MVAGGRGLASPDKFSPLFDNPAQNRLCQDAGVYPASNHIAQ